MAENDRFGALARALVADPAHPVDLGEAALCVAADHRPGLDVAAGLARLDALAEAARPTVLGAWSDAARVQALNEFLFVREGFHGNVEEYDDPRNSLFDQVLERRTGLPITLSLVYLEVGRRLGLPVEGIGFPSHFLVRWRGREDAIVDAFHGRVLSDQALAAMLRQALGRDVVFQRMELEPITPHAFLVRLLSNLKRHTALAGDFAATLLCCERLLQLQPDDLEQLRDRGLVYAQLDCVGAARDDLSRFLARAPAHPSAASVQARLHELDARRVVLN